MRVLFPFAALICFVPFNSYGGTYDLNNVNSIIVHDKFSASRDHDGLTTEPPNLWEFAEVFRDDLAGIGVHVVLKKGGAAAKNSIFCTLDSETSFHDAAGRNTSEGYRLSVTSTGVTLAGASPLGVFWGTRTALQQAVLNNKKLAIGDGVDSPGWPERGMMLDVARHYYPADFLVEMCAYLSFFKQNVFQLHLSDNVWSAANLYSHDLSMELYAAFRVTSDDPAVSGLARPVNETYSPSVLDDIQRRCALRGVTILPELESPGHSIATTDWKPEIALADFSMLNLSHPETLPTVKAYWNAVIDNFHSKIVHLGGDEYLAGHVADYNSFINEMQSYIKERSGKSTRVWGTFPPSADIKNVDKAVTIQHWQIGQDNALFDFINNGYMLVNSDDFFYLDVKYSYDNVYPKELDISRVFHGSPDGSPFAPNIFDHTNATNNPPRKHPNILGHLAVVWNDWGNNASTYHEAYYMVRDGLPALADKTWGGNLSEEDYARLFAVLQPAAPAQNLDLRIPSISDTILSYRFSQDAVSGSIVRDRSGNQYDASLKNGASVANDALVLNGLTSHLQTPLRSKGRDFKLSFSVRPEAPGGELFSSPDTMLLNGNGSSAYLMVVSGNIAYPVNIVLPNHKWSNITMEGIGAQTFLSVTSACGKETRMEVTVLIGIWGERLQEASISFSAPISRIGYGFKGLMKNILLLANGTEM